MLLLWVMVVVVVIVAVVGVLPRGRGLVRPVPHGLWDDRILLLSDAFVSPCVSLYGDAWLAVCSPHESSVRSGPLSGEGAFAADVLFLGVETKGGEGAGEDDEAG